MEQGELIDADRRLHVLLVEDSANEYKLFALVLGRNNLGHVVTWVQDGEKALQLLQSEEFDVVILDFKLPGMDGLEVFNGILKLGIDLPVVFLTGAGNEQVAVDAMKMGAQDYIIKDANGEFLRSLPVVISKAYRQWKDKKACEEYERERESRTHELQAFAYTVAHDLKSPLQIITGYAGVLTETDQSTQDQKRQLDIILRTSRKMADVIDELLNFTVLKSVKQTAISSVEMSQIVEQAMQRLDSLIAQNQAVFRLPSAWSTGLGYGPWIEEVWVNYISNAIKYGGRPPVVELGSTVKADGTVKFWVRDNGAGLTEAQQRELFAPYSRPGQVQGSGHGLGLSIVKRIVERLGGTVGVDSVVGKGSTFWFMLESSEMLK